MNIRGGRFILGFASGVGVALAMVVSCQQLDSSHAAGAPTAGEVAYANGHSGLEAQDLQSAIDEIGTTVHAATTIPRLSVPSPAKGPQPTTWSIQLIDTQSAGIAAVKESNTGKVTFTETSPGRGTFTLTGPNVLVNELTDGGTAKSGNFLVRGNTMVINAPTCAQPNCGRVAFGWSLSVSDAGNTITLGSQGPVSGTFVVLTKE